MTMTVTTANFMRVSRVRLEEFLRLDIGSTKPFQKDITNVQMLMNMAFEEEFDANLRRNVVHRMTIE